MYMYYKNCNYLKIRAVLYKTKFFISIFCAINRTTKLKQQIFFLIVIITVNGHY